MEIVGLYRYPVKSAQGEALDSAAIGEHGITGDRSHALIDVETGVALTGRLDPSLLFATGMLSEDRSSSLRLPDGTVTADDVVISAWIGRPVHLAGAVAAASMYEIRVDAEDESSEIVSWKGPSGVYHDSARTRVSIVATGDLRDWDVRRFPTQRRRRRGHGRPPRRPERPPRRCRARHRQEDRPLRDDHPAAARRHRTRT